MAWSPVVTVISGVSKSVEAVVGSVFQRGQRIASSTAAIDIRCDDKIAGFDDTGVGGKVSPDHRNPKIFEGLEEPLVDEAMRVPLAAEPQMTTLRKCLACRIVS